MTEISTFLNTHSGIIALVGLLVAVLAFAVPLIRAKTTEKRTDLREDIADPESRARLAKDCAQTSAAAYDDAVDRLLGWTDRTFGTRREIGKTFRRCVQFATLYPILALMLGWMFLDVGTLGGVDFLPSGGSLWHRSIATAIMVFIALLVGNLPTLSESVSRVFNRIIGWIFSSSGYLQTITAYISSVAYVLVSASLTIAFAVGSMSTVGGVVFVSGIVIVGSAFVVAGLGIWASAAAVGVLLVQESSGTDSFGITVYFLFLLLLPLLNAIADFLSLYASRYFLEKLHDRAKGARFPLRLILVEIVVDIIVALACLAGLLLSFTWVLDQWAAFFPDTLAFDWRAYRDAILAGDYSQIHLVALLGITTLVPTAVHIVIGLRAFFKQRGRLRANCAESLRALGDQTSVAPDISRDIADQIIQGDKRGTVWAFVCTTAFMGCLCVVAWLGFLWFIAP